MLTGRGYILFGLKKMLSPIPYLVLTLSFLTLSLSTLLTILNRKPRKGRDHRLEEYPSVSLLIPIKNIDDELGKNLHSYYESDYPDLEVLFGVDTPDDEVVPVLEAVAARYPQRPTRIIFTGQGRWENPKIHKLAYLEKASRGRLFWVCDSNIRVEPETLRHLVDSYLDQGAKIVFSPIRGTSSRSFASLVENSYLNFFLSGSVITAWTLFRQQIVCGKSILIEREALQWFGGFSFYRDYLAEDFLLGESFTRSRFPIAMSRTWVTNINQSTTIAKFLARMTRWAKLRWHLKPGLYLLEVVLNPIALSLPLVIAWGLPGMAVAVGTTILKITLEALVFGFINTQDRTSALNILRFPAAVVVKDILLLVVYFAPFFSRTVNWRGGKIGIGKKTMILARLGSDRLNFDGV
jgi:ceramide glucosyltransferase